VTTVPSVLNSFRNPPPTEPPPDAALQTLLQTLNTETPVDLTDTVALQTALENYNPNPHLLLPVLTSIQNQTGVASDCGTPDVWGDVAFFNKLCVATAGISPQAVRETFAQVGESAGAQSIPQNTATVLNQFQNLQVSDPTFFVNTTNGIQVLRTGSYVLTVTVQWANAGGGTVRQVSVLTNGTPLYLNDFVPIMAQSFNYTVTQCFSTGQIIGCSVQHDGTSAIPGPAIYFLMYFLGG